MSIVRQLGRRYGSHVSFCIETKVCDYERAAQSMHRGFACPSHVARVAFYLAFTSAHSEAQDQLPHVLPYLAAKGQVEARAQSIYALLTECCAVREDEVVLKIASRHDDSSYDHSLLNHRSVHTLKFVAKHSIAKQFTLKLIDFKLNEGYTKIQN
eukprot:5677090-Pleurochrysis_carterae.AAC.1